MKTFLFWAFVGAIFFIIRFFFGNMRGATLIAMVIAAILVGIGYAIRVGISKEPLEHEDKETDN